MRGRAPMAGMTLIELMCVMVVVAIMSAYVLPLYRESLARGRRQSVMVAVQAAALEVEARISDDGASQRGKSGSNTTGDSPTSVLSKSEVMMAGRPAYRLAVRGGHAGSQGTNVGGEMTRDDRRVRYIIEAVPVQGGIMQDDRCGTFLLDSEGKRYNRRSPDKRAPMAGGPEDTVVGPCWTAGA